MPTGEFAVVEAVLDSQGQLLGVIPKKSSAWGELDVDTILFAACRQTIAGLEVPPGAEGNDGLVHLVFELRVEVVAGSDGKPTGYRAKLSGGLL